jgi:hypothetical protein
MSDNIPEPPELHTERHTVPLVMIEGNMGVLLNNTLPVQGISLKWSDEFPGAVVLLVHGVDREAADALGFQTRHENKGE